MKLLLISDKECPALWDYYQPGRLKGVDMILSCGDLNSKYLSFLVTMAGVPLIYVHGNHDKTYDAHPPEGVRLRGGPHPPRRGAADFRPGRELSVQRRPSPVH